jgi:hypothetical protein
MRQDRVLITETNIAEETHPQAVRYVLEAETEANAAEEGRKRFREQAGRDVAPRAIVDVEPVA